MQGQFVRGELGSPRAGLLERFCFFCAELRRLGVGVATGVLWARMEVELVNDGRLRSLSSFRGVGLHMCLTYTGLR